MVAKAGSHLLAATAFAVLTSAGLGAGSAWGQSAACLAAPNGAAPAGTHWFYKTDPGTHQKCWYTRPQEQSTAAPAETTPSPSTLERGDAVSPDSGAAAPGESAAPVALAPTAAPPVPARAPLPAPAVPRRVAPSIARVPVPTADPRGENQPTTAATTAMPAPTAIPGAPDNVAWPAPPPVPQTAGLAGSPFPPPPDVTPQVNAAAPSTAAQAPSADGPAGAASPPSTTGQTPTAGKPNSDGGAEQADADKPAAAKPPGRLSVLLVVGGLIVLLIAGMLLRRIVEHALSRRRVIKLARHEPRLVEPLAVPPPMPTLLRQAPSVVPGSAQRASEVEAELRKFAENLRQHRPAATGTAGGIMGRSGTALRS
jgi:hypothetical protein